MATEPDTLLDVVVSHLERTAVPFACRGIGMNGLR
jgi:hypothetical protein